MSIQAQRAIFLFSLFLISCVSAHAQLRTGVTNRPPDYDSLGGFRCALERVSEAAVAAPQSDLPSSKVGCSVADTAEQPCPMRILFHGYVDGHWRTGLGAISSQGISAVTNLTPSSAVAELSYDGESVVYVNCGAPDPERAIYIVSLATSESSKVIPIDRGKYCPEVRWSLDGRMLSYQSTTDYALNVVSVDGSNHVRLPTTGFVGWHSWSPSGEEIVYENGRGGARSLQIIDLRGKVRELTRFGELNSCETWAPDWSPDGTRISFVSCDGRLFTVSPQGTDMQQLASHAYSPRWSVDGQWILFLSGSVLMRVRRDGQFLSRVAELPPPYSGSTPFSLGMVR